MSHTSYKLSAEQKAEIVSRYQHEGISIKALASDFGVGYRSVWNILSVRGVERRPRGVGRIHTLNEGAFDEINECSAYWLGFLMADGCVHHIEGDYPVLTLRLARRDRTHVFEFRRFLGSSHPVKSDAAGNPGLQVGSRPLADRLASFGIVPRKSKTAEAMGNIVDVPHFWRGVVDGDGSLGFWRSYRDRSRRFCLSLVGSQPLCEQFAAFVTRSTGFVRSVNRAGPIYAVRLVGDAALAVARVLYDNCQVALPRKRRLAFIARRGVASQ